MTGPGAQQAGGRIRGLTAAQWIAVGALWGIAAGDILGTVIAWFFWKCPR